MDKSFAASLPNVPRHRGPSGLCRFPFRDGQATPQGGGARAPENVCCVPDRPDRRGGRLNPDTASARRNRFRLYSSIYFFGEKGNLVRITDFRKIEISGETGIPPTGTGVTGRAARALIPLRSKPWSGPPPCAETPLCAGGMTFQAGREQFAVPSPGAQEILLFFQTFLLRRRVGMGMILPQELRPE